MAEVGDAMGGGALSVAEQRLVDAAGAGRVCDLLSESSDGRRVRAGVLYDLWVGDRWPLHPKAAHLKHAVIEDDLDFDYGTLRAPLRLTGCRLEGALGMEGASAPALVAVGCEFVGAVRASSLRSGTIVLDRSTFHSTVDLTGACVERTMTMDEVTSQPRAGSDCALVLDQLSAGGSVMLRRAQLVGAVLARGARVEFNFDLSGTQITVSDRDGYALDMRAIRVGGCIFAYDARTVGAVHAVWARIDLSIEMDGASIAGTDAKGRSLDIKGLETGRSAFLRRGFETTGAIDAMNARFGRNLDMSAASLGGVNSDGTSLDATGIDVGGLVKLNDGFRTKGAVNLAGATVQRTLTLEGAHLEGPDRNGCALDGHGLRVSGDVNLDNGFRSTGAVRLSAATIDGHLSLRGAELAGATDPFGNSLAAHGVHVRGSALFSNGFRTAAAVRLTGATVEGQLSFVNARPIPTLSLRGAHCAELADDPSSWPATGYLDLRGFRFGTIKSDANWTDRLDWARRQGFGMWSPDPYEQLTSYYSSTGDEDAARRIRIARNRDELTHLKSVDERRSRVYRLRRRPFGWLLGYGYQRHRAGWLLAATVLAAGCLFRQADKDHAMVPNVEPAVAGEPCGQAYACFDPWIYGADVVLPIIDFGQDTAWRPAETPEHGALWPRIRWTLVALGWILASVVVVAFTGLVQRG